MLDVPWQKASVTNYDEDLYEVTFRQGTLDNLEASVSQHSTLVQFWCLIGSTIGRRGANLQLILFVSYELEYAQKKTIAARTSPIHKKGRIFISGLLLLKICCWGKSPPTTPLWDSDKCSPLGNTLIIFTNSRSEFVRSSIDLAAAFMRMQLRLSRLSLHPSSYYNRFGYTYEVFQLSLSSIFYPAAPWRRYTPRSYIKSIISIQCHIWWCSDT